MTPLLLLLSLFVVPQTTAPRPSSPDYTVGPDDVLDITVVGEPMFSNKYRIRRDGTFEFPNLGPIKASGLTLRSLEEMLTTRLQKENILLRPQITIEVAEFRSQTIYVMGQVADQGMVALTGSKTIVDVLAGRLLPSAGDEIIINRRKPGTEASGPVLAATDPETRLAVAGVLALGLPNLNELGWRWRDSLIYLTHGVPNEPTFSVSAIIDRVHPSPLAAIHSTQDEFVPLAEVERLLASAQDPKRLWVVKASDHRFSDNLDEFDRRLLDAIAWINQNAAR